MKLSISQNNITDREVIDKLIQASELGANDVVLDIGAGTGLITGELAKACRKVLAFELDHKLFLELKAKFKDITNIELISGNFLDYPLKKLDVYKVFSNIPFSITSDIMTKLYFHGSAPEIAYLVMQKEAALRYMGKRDNTLISLLLQPWYDLNIMYNFDPADFSPAPSVETVLLRINKISKPELSVNDMEDFRNFVIYALDQQKPTLKLRLNKVFSDLQFTRLSHSLKFPKDVVASKLRLDQWLGLFRYYKTGVVADKKLSVASAGHAYMKQLRKFSGVSSRKN